MVRRKKNNSSRIKSNNGKYFLVESEARSHLLSLSLQFKQSMLHGKPIDSVNKTSSKKHQKMWNMIVFNLFEGFGDFSCGGGQSSKEAWGRWWDDGWGHEARGP